MAGSRKQSEGREQRQVRPDRDIVVEAIAKDVNVDELAVGDIMSRELVTARENNGIYDTIQLMRSNSIR